MENTLRLSTLLLCSLMVTAVWAQDKNVTVQTQAAPFFSMQEKQRQAPANAAAIPGKTGNDYHNAEWQRAAAAGSAV